MCSSWTSGVFQALDLWRDVGLTWTCTVNWVPDGMCSCRAGAISQALDLWSDIWFT